MVFEWIASFAVNGLGLTGRLADAAHFWIYDTLKIVFILFTVILGIGYLRTYIKPERIRDYLKGKHSIFGYLGAAALGIVSPFCSCSTIPIFIGFVGAGIPFGMIITFLFVSPMVNEAASVVLLGTLGWKITLAYIAGGVLIGVSGGFILKKLGFEKYIKEFDMASKKHIDEEISKRQRLKLATTEARDIVKQILPYVIVGVGIGAAVHGYLPEELITNYLTGPLAVPVAVLVGVPIYTNIMGVIPVVESLIGKGLPIGTSIAFMMSVAALSLPQFVMLKKVMEKKLIAAYAAIISIGILSLGLLFNLVL